MKRFGLVIIALATFWFSFRPNQGLPLPQVLAQSDSSPLDQENADQENATQNEDGTPFPTVTPTLTETPTIIPTATLTPTATSTPGNIAQIEFPANNAVIAGFTTIRGTALIDHYRKFDIHISVSGFEEWQWVTTSYSITRGGNLYSLDTSDFSDGYYDLRLRAIQDGGDFNEATSRRVEIRNANPPTPTPALNAEGTPVTSPLEAPTMTPTPTPTLDVRVRIPGAQGFYGPDEESVIQGYTPIKATVNNLGFNFFERYELFVSPAGLEEWTHLISDVEQHWQSTIYMLNTLLYPDGAYDLRLRVVYQDGNYSEYHLRRLQIRNGDRGSSAYQSAYTNGIHQPSSGQQVSGTVDFVGTAVDADFLRWELYWSPSNAEAWSFLVRDDDSAVAEVLARLDLSQLPADSYDFRLRIVRKDYNYDEYFVRNIYLKQSPPESSNGSGSGKSREQSIIKK